MKCYHKDVIVLDSNTIRQMAQCSECKRVVYKNHGDREYSTEIKRAVDKRDRIVK